MKCPFCSVEPTAEHTLRKHLTGSKRYGGHEISLEDATKIAAEVAYGRAFLHKAIEPIRDEIPDVSDNLYARYVKELFLTLRDNKRLPFYQFERRVDVMLQLFLPEIISKTLGWTVELIAPEFPLKQVDTNRRNPVDFILFRQEQAGSYNAAWVLVELKTDRNSINEAQLIRYRAQLSNLTLKINEDIVAPSRRGKYASKYRALMSLLENLPYELPIELVYLTPEKPGYNAPQDNITFLTFTELYTLHLEHHGEVWELFRTIVLPSLF